jgi:hypothetical protein
MAADKFFNAFKLGNLNASTRSDTGRVQENANRAGQQSVRPGDDAAAAQAQAEAAALSSIQNQIYYVDGSDAMANQGFTVSFMHVPSGNSVFFKAFITAFNETFSCDWSEEAVYGRADPIRMFKQNTRNITLALMVPAASEGEAFENLAKIQKLVSYLYPSYADTNNALTISQSPLIRMRVFNLATNAGAYYNSAGSVNEPETPNGNEGYTYENLKKGLGPGRVEGEGEGATRPVDGDVTGTGLLGIIKNLSINHNLENTDMGVFQYKGGNVLPKAIEINLDFGVIHEHPLGWNETGDFSNNVFPYGANLEQSKPKTQTQLAKEMNAGAMGYISGALAQQREEEDERLNEQAKQIAQAKYLKANGKLNRHGRNLRDSTSRTPTEQRIYDQITVPTGQESQDASGPTEPSAPQVNVDFATLIGQ